ncbi:class A beta-lactamase-related serine hydrolase [Labedella phragmitis]|uniref:Class A beta-lactamase-related serine hydrolase n=1 Tax=Labedella phragmitis TaxID=2498849 RepID=A0A444PT72_9MICO|nr:serine hydrolase domain-containing protein [Labedella phragmitis]RWZ51076.1 class A beta-lactamase-related serine hydrolase [Labedella phragmitis]
MRFRSGIGRRLVAVTAAATLLVLAGCSSNGSASIDLPAQADAPLPDDIRTRIDDAVERGMSLSAASGAIVGVWAPWAGFHLEGYGTSEFGGDRPMTPDMHFRAAATTKAMTCAVLFGLVDEGKVALDDSAGDFVNVVGIEGVTLGQLCRSTAGLANFRSSFQDEFVTNPTRPWVASELVSDGIARSGGAEPGAAYAEDDTAYVLLGMALERIGGESLAELFDRYVFDPIGMSQSSLPGARTTTLPDPAPHGYQVLNDDCASPKDLSELSPSMLGTAGGAVTTADDLKRFTQAYATGAMFSEKSTEKLWTTIPLGAEVPTWQAYGFGAFQIGPLRGQVGSIPGFSTAAFSDPESGLTVVVMLNSSSARSKLVRALALELASYAVAAPATGDGKAPETTLPWSPEQMQAESADVAVCQ